MSDLFNNILADDIFGDAELFAADQAADKELKRAARAMKTKNRRNYRRAKSEQQLASILPDSIESGESWHVLSAGDVDSLSYLAHAIKAQRFDHVMFSTWCMAMEDVQQFGRWINDGLIGRLDAYVGEIFPNQYADEYAALAAIVRPTGGRLCTFRNHSKIFACRSGDYGLVIESSANINTNPRAENTVLTADIELYRFQLDYFQGVRSFNRDFDDWQPA